jgi:hypothetical protein
MKYLLLITSVIVCLCLSCKKDKVNIPQRFLSKVYEDGLMQTEYNYSADKKPSRRNDYVTGSGQSVLSSYRLYKYTADGLLAEVTSFNADNKFLYRYILQYDANKHIVHMDDVKSDNSVQYIHLYDYDANGRITKANYDVPNSTKKILETIYIYNEKGNLKGINRYAFNNSTRLLTDSSTYVFGQKSLPIHWNYFEMLLPVSMPNIDYTFSHITCESSFNYYVDAPPRKTTITISDKKYSDDVYITEQRISTSYSNGFTTTVSSKKMTYEYTE